MTHHAATIRENAHPRDGCDAQLRTSLGPTFIVGALLCARRAREIEAMSEVSELLGTEHLSSVISAIVQAAAAIEAEAVEVAMHGPWTRVPEALEFDTVDQIGPLLTERKGQAMRAADSSRPLVEKWNKILVALCLRPFDVSTELCREVALLNQLRSEVVHFRSHWGGEVKGPRSGLLGALQAKDFKRPSFRDPGLSAYPYHVLSAACAHWAATVAVRFIDDATCRVYGRSRLQHFRNESSPYKAIFLD